MNEIEKKGYLEVEIDPALDLFEEINRMKKEKNAATTKSLILKNSFIGVLSNANIRPALAKW